MIQRKNIDNPPYYKLNDTVYYVPPKCGFTVIKNSGLSVGYGVPPDNMKILLCLRHPALRLISAYNSLVVQGGFIRELDQYGEFAQWEEDFGRPWIDRWMTPPVDPVQHFDQFARWALPNILYWGADFHWNSISRFIACTDIADRNINYIDYRHLPKLLNLDTTMLNTNPGTYSVPFEAYRIAALMAVRNHYTEDLTRWQRISINTI